MYIFKKYTPTEELMAVSAERRSKLSAALRSGEFLQGMGMLYQESENGKECFCCLGVDQAINGIEPISMEGLTMPSELGNSRSMPREGEELAEVIAACSRRVDESGLSYESEHNYTTKNTLDSLNDSEALSFEQIADLLDGHEVTVRTSI